VNAINQQLSIAVGTMRNSGSFNGLMVLDRDRQEAHEFLRTAVDQGFTTFDTAPVYARGLAEEDIGQVVPAEATVWTKVGVDIAGALPKLDYSHDGLVASLTGSLRRLRRTSVDVAFVHNPAPDVLATAALASFAEHCTATGAAMRVGVSVLAPRISMPLIAPRLPADSVIMCEADQLVPADTATMRLLAGYRLVVRSLFSGGKALRSVAAAERPSAIAARIAEIARLYAPAGVVIGPRTREQLLEYAPGAASPTAAEPLTSSRW
jgi:predicted oxidoreductase